MDAESFTDLALRVISREATDDECRALEAELVSAPGHRDEFERLRLTHKIVRVAAPLMQAAQATTPELPAHRVNELRTAVRQHFGPAVNRKRNRVPFGEWVPVMRWLFAG